MSSKQEILARVRNALSAAGSDEQRIANAPEIPRKYRREGTKSQSEVIDLLVERLEDYGAHVYREASKAVAQRVAELVGDQRCAVPNGLAGADELAKLADEPTVDTSGVDLEQIDVVVTRCTTVCAETGTIFLTAQDDEGRRALTLVPDHHVCVVPEGKVVEIVPQALACLEVGRPTTLISGPSATSDIELERVDGVHGPRRLDVIIARS